jgi:hypothetical protein
MISDEAIAVDVLGAAVVADSSIAHNVTGINAGNGGVVRVSNSTITANTFGIATQGTGSVLSRTPANNTLEGNTTDGSFTGTFAAD